MSKIAEVIKSKNAREKSIKNRRRQELKMLRDKSAFKARLYEELQKVSALINTGEVEGVIVEIPDAYISRFAEAIYSADLAEYDVRQIENDTNKFYIKHKIIQF